MGLLWSRVGSEGYYSSLDKQFAAIQTNISSLEDGKRRRYAVWSHVQARFLAGFLALYFIIIAYAAWVTRQPPGHFTASGHAKRVAPVFLAPIIAYTVYSVAEKLRSTFDRRADAQIKQLQVKLNKMIADLKDSTRYQQTQELLQKYDPDTITLLQMAKAKKNASSPSGIAQNSRGSGGGKKKTSLSPQQQQQQQQQAGNNSQETPPLPPHTNTKSVAGAVTSLSSALGSMFSTAAEKLIADDPQVVAMLRDAQTKARMLEEENEFLRRQMSLLQQQPTQQEEEDGGGGGGFGSPVSLVPPPTNTTNDDATNPTTNTTTTTIVRDLQNELEKEK